MNALAVVWIIAGFGLCLVLSTIAYTLWARSSAERVNQQSGNVWKRAHQFGAELAAGTDVDANAQRLTDLVANATNPIFVASALAVVVRQTSGDVDSRLFWCVRGTSLPKILHNRLKSDDSDTVVEALEIAETLKLHSLLGDAAALTRHGDPIIVRAACDTVVALDPQIGLGVLLGLVANSESWVLDSVGRAMQELKRRGGDDAVPLAAGHWRNAPMLASRALLESATFDRDTVGDAVSTLIGALDDPSSAKRLAAIKALSICIGNTAAQLALAGALGSSDRMTRYAAAAALSDTVIGRHILECTTKDQDGSDAARMATEILWLYEPDRLDSHNLVA